VKCRSPPSHLTSLRSKGAKIVFDLSSERGYNDDRYYEVVGALYQGRAQTTGAFLVQANTGAATKPNPAVVHAGRYAGSHGNSQLVNPRGEARRRLDGARSPCSLAGGGRRCSRRRRTWASTWQSPTST